MGDKDREVSTTLSDLGEDVMTGIAFNVKQNRSSILKEFVDDAFSEAIASLPESERAEIAKRLRKLFVNAFKTPEMDRLVREKVSEHAHVVCTRMVETYIPRIESFLQEELEMTWRDIVSGYVKSLLAGAIVKVGQVFAKKLDGFAEETYQTGVNEAAHTPSEKAT